ncbi:MAG: ParB/RepB/Spo0J family partition protein, partial [Gammaproteobacteria bacterium]|nr:ParB/RepB/Spo0J family partition protein [Gammaproteobacteria bacterium]
QPRKEMNPAALEELANSIKAQGLLQPIVVRPIDTNQYEVIAGERRWRAAELAGLTEIPALIRDVSDQITMALALIENIQRENLNPMEEAAAIHRLIEECDLTHNDVAQTLGKSRVTVTNLLRLMTLNADVKYLLECGDIDLGHAKVLLSLTGHQQSYAAKLVAEKNLSVRETEALVKKLQNSLTKKPIKHEDPDIRDLIQSLSEKLGAKIDIQHGAKGKGKLSIYYNTLDELEGILAHME